MNSDQIEGWNAIIWNGEDYIIFRCGLPSQEEAYEWGSAISAERGYKLSGLVIDELKEFG